MRTSRSMTRCACAFGAVALFATVIPLSIVAGESPASAALFSLTSAGDAGAGTLRQAIIDGRLTEEAAALRDGAAP